MSKIWKKWIKAPPAMRAVIVLLYVFSALEITRDHTCQQQSVKDAYNLHSYHSECTQEKLKSDNCHKEQSASVSNQTGPNKTELLHSYCLACFHSLISKTFKFCSNTSLSSIKVICRTQVLLQLSFARQFERLPSIALRAPPILIS